MKTVRTMMADGVRGNEVVQAGKHPPEAGQQVLPDGESDHAGRSCMTRSYEGGSGAGSDPPLENGLHLATRHTASPDPTSAPRARIAWAA